MRNLISKLFLVAMLFCASGFASAVTTLNVSSTQADVDAAIQAAGSAGYDTLSVELANAHVPTQFILNSVAKFYGVQGLQSVVNAFAAVLGMPVAPLNSSATAAIIAIGQDPATSGFTPATASGGEGGGGGAAAAGPGFTPVPSGTGAVSPA